MAVALALALAGCGGSQKTVTVTQQLGAPVATSTSGGAASTAASTSGSSAAASTAASTPGSSAAASTAASSSGSSGATTSASRPLSISTFESPSGNIGCIILGGVARCDIKHRAWSPPPRPSTCPKEVDFGQGLEVSSSGAGRFVCAGDTALDPSAAKLAYGQRTAVGRITCASAASGMTCKNSGGGGFFISIQSYKVY